MGTRHGDARHGDGPIGTPRQLVDFLIKLLVGIVLIQTQDRGEGYYGKRTKKKE